MSHLFCGFIDPDGRKNVFCTGSHGVEPLDPARELGDYGTETFGWGKGDPGGSQLALAILLRHSGCPFLALELHQRFRGEVVRYLPQHNWILSGATVELWLGRQAERILMEEASHEQN